MLWGVISLAMVIVFNLFSQPQHSSQPSVTYSEFLRQAAKGEVSEVVIQEKLSLWGVSGVNNSVSENTMGHQEIISAQLYGHTF